MWEKNMEGGYSLRLKVTSKDFGATAHTLSTISEWKQKHWELLKMSLQIRVSCFLNIQSTTISTLNPLLLNHTVILQLELSVQF